MGKKKRRGKNYGRKSEFLITTDEMVCITCAEYIPAYERHCETCPYNPGKKNEN